MLYDVGSFFSIWCSVCLLCIDRRLIPYILRHFLLWFSLKYFTWLWVSSPPPVLVIHGFGLFMMSQGSCTFHQRVLLSFLFWFNIGWVTQILYLSSHPDTLFHVICIIGEAFHWTFNLTYSIFHFTFYFFLIFLQKLFWLNSISLELFSFFFVLCVCVFVVFIPAHIHIFFEFLRHWFLYSLQPEWYSGVVRTGV